MIKRQNKITKYTSKQQLESYTNDCKIHTNLKRNKVQKVQTFRIAAIGIIHNGCT